MFNNKRNASVAIFVALMVVVNLVALNWSWRYFRQPDRASFPRYDDAMPALEGPDYLGGRGRVTVAAGDVNLLVYLPGPYLNARAISLVKSGAAFEREYRASGLRFTLIAGGPLPSVQKLAEDGVVNAQAHERRRSSQGQAARVGLLPGRLLLL